MVGKTAQYTKYCQELHRILISSYHPKSQSDLAEQLGCSSKTVRRTIEKMRDQFHAPIETYKNPLGYGYNKKQKDIWQLPGLWLTSEELQALALLLELLEQFGSGLFTEDMQVLENSIEQLLETNGIDKNKFLQTIRIIPLTTRYTSAKSLQTIYQAINQSTQLQLHYTDYHGNNSERNISPQRLTWYRENWYLDAWCHMAEEIRIFALARIDGIKLSKKPLHILPIEQLKQHFKHSYGIFAGEAKHTAALRFFQEAAREAALQQWHPKQHGQWQGMEYLLHIPYSNHSELVQDILRFVPHVRVEEPQELKEEVINRLKIALQQYQ